MPSIKLNIREAFSYNLGLITEDNGYNTTIRRVFDPPVDYERIDDFPAINVHIDEDDIINANDNMLAVGGNRPKQLGIYNIIMDCFFMSENNPQDDQDKILADIQEMFGVNFHVNDSNGNKTAFMVLYAYSEPFGIRNKSPLYGITVAYRVWYRQLLTNPVVAV